MKKCEKIKFGIIGMSEGNGHPYSWAAICNGYNSEIMEQCPFPVIYEYLQEQNFPDVQINEAAVTHVWTQDPTLSNHIAKASNIKFVAQKMEDMIGKVDAVLLARDDAENHVEMAKPFIEAGCPIYIDKPITLSLNELDYLYSLEKYEGQIFTCSTLSYSNEIEKAMHTVPMDEIERIDAVVCKSWEKYSVHIIEPTIRLLDKKIIFQEKKIFNDEIRLLAKTGCGINISFCATGNALSPIIINLFSRKKRYKIQFNDAFNAHKNGIIAFLNQIRKIDECKLLSREQTFNCISLIEKGIIG